ncbi:MAG: glycosyltransferase family 4 protein [Sulfurovaceae bacterium]|nr:glycosyltransferase family 4 protein [Sulfurovaceae bacterium]
MKIVQILPELNEGGVERGTMELSREFVKRGHESIVISCGGKLASQIEADGGRHIKIDVCKKNPFNSLWRVYQLHKVLQDLKPDIVHVRSRVPAWLTYFAKRGLDIKIVSTVHGFNSVNFYSSIMTKADAVICVSNSIKEYIQEHYHTQDEKITVIPRGIDLKLFNQNNLDKQFIADFKKKYGLDDKFIVSTVGRITQLKDIETFIRAIVIVKETIPQIKALIVGGVHIDKQNYFESLKDLVQELHLDDEVIFAGSQSKVAEIYMLSNVVVSASKKPESFGRSVAEAIAINTPVVATNHGGVRDIIKDGINGYLINVEDVNELAIKIIESKDLKFDGYKYITDNFSLGQMVKKTLKVYKGIL